MDTQTLLNRIMLGLLILVMTVLMNTMLRPVKIQKPQQTFTTVKEEIKTEKKVYSEPLLSNNQKAAIFLAFPLGGMVWIASIVLIKNRKKIAAAASNTTKREPRVVF